MERRVYNPFECCYCYDVLGSRIFLYRHMAQRHTKIAFENPHENPHENCITCLKRGEIEKYLPLSENATVEYFKDKPALRGEAKIAELQFEFETIYQDSLAIVEVVEIPVSSKNYIAAIKCCKCGLLTSYMFESMYHNLQGGFQWNHDPTCKQCRFFTTLYQNITIVPMRDVLIGFYLLDKDLEDRNRNIMCCCGCNLVYPSTLAFIMHYVFSVSRNGAKHPDCFSCNLKDVLGEYLYYRTNSLLVGQNSAWFNFLCQEFLALAEGLNSMSIDILEIINDPIVSSMNCP